MTKLKKLAMSVPIFLWFATPHSLNASSFEWNYNGEAKALGSGCPRNSTHIIAAGSDLSIVFTNMEVDLKAHASSARVQRKSCRIAVPTKLNSNFYLSQLEQKFSYSYQRTAGTDGKIIIATQVAGQSAQRIQKNAPDDQEDPYEVVGKLVAQTDQFARPAGHCAGGEDWLGNSKINIVLSGYRSSLDALIYIGLEGQNKSLNLRAHAKSCLREPSQQQQQQSQQAQQ